MGAIHAFPKKPSHEGKFLLLQPGALYRQSPHTALGMRTTAFTPQSKKPCKLLTYKAF